MLTGKAKVLFFLLVFFALQTGCDTNFMQPFASEPDSTEYKLEKIKVLLDDRDYDKALELTNEMIEDPEQDSNDVRILQVAASLGVSGLDVWSLLSTVLESNASANIGQVLADISGEALGEGEEKTTKLQSLELAVQTLQSAPEAGESRISNTACYLGGLMVAPIIAGAATLFQELSTSLSGLTTDSCTVAGLNSTLLEVSSLASRFSLVLTIAQSCTLLELNTSDLNSINGILGRLSENADLGCDSSVFPANSDTVFPSCIRGSLGIPNSTIRGQDNVISQCELVLHCIDPTNCF